MHSFETIDLGTYRGDDYFLTGFVDPDPAQKSTYDPDRDASDYGVALARAPTYPHEDTIEIVRLDTSHGQPHIDHLYLPENTNQQRKEWLSSGYSYSRMKQYLLTLDGFRGPLYPVQRVNPTPSAAVSRIQPLEDVRDCPR